MLQLQKTALLGEDKNSITEAPQVTMQGLAKMMTSVNNNMPATASSVALLGSTLNRSRDESPGNSRPNKNQKTIDDPTCNDNSRNDHVSNRVLKFAQPNYE